MTKENAMTIIETMVSQLGGNKALAMTGGRFIADTENCTLRFIFKGSRKMNRVHIKYDEALDLYNMDFLKYSPSKMTSKSVKTFEGVYCDQLIELFEETTGLYLSL
ncbi:MAG: hypothetical protein PF569_01445 [Candidatus Woesearchaeota archaeon]|jgi:hypothetical protein|nr:hypothetical protein [Candidatus Woesearchaeota archaeon]